MCKMAATPEYHDRGYHDLWEGKGIIDWIKYYTLLYLSILANWMRRIRLLVSSFQRIAFGHIYRNRIRSPTFFHKKNLKGSRQDTICCV